LIEIINKQLLLQLVGYLCYWQMGFNSAFKGLIYAWYYMWSFKPTSAFSFLINYVEFMTDFLM